MTRTVLLLATNLFVLSATTAVAGTPKVEVFTAGPDGFLVTSTIVSGDKDAILVDAQFTLSEAHRLAAKLLESKRTLKTVFITHAHPDHFFGVEVIKRAFPKAEVVATPAVIAEMKKITKGKHGYWKPLYGDNLTASPVFPKPFTKDHLDLEGTRIELVPLAAGESEASTVVWIPSIKTLITGDASYEDVHVYLVETDAARRSAWLASLSKLEALGPEVVVSGHRSPNATNNPSALKRTADYLRHFDQTLAATKTAEEIAQKLKSKYAEYQLPIIADLSAQAAAPKK